MHSILSSFGNDVDFEKCGDVIISPKHNLCALFCHFCHDVFKQIPEFVGHLQAAHGDVLAFSEPRSVYCVEELLKNEDQDIINDVTAVVLQDQSDHNNIDDPNLLQTQEIAFDKKNTRDENNKKNYNIIDDWSEEQTDNESEGSGKPQRSVLREVESMLFDEDDCKTVENPPPTESDNTAEKQPTVPADYYCIDAWMQALERSKVNQKPSHIDETLMMSDTLSMMVESVDNANQKFTDTADNYEIIRSSQLLQRRVFKDCTEERINKPITTNVSAQEENFDGKKKDKVDNENGCQKLKSLDSKSCTIKRVSQKYGQLQRVKQRILCSLSSETTTMDLNQITNMEHFMSKSETLIVSQGITKAPTEVQPSATVDQKCKANVQIESIEILPPINLSKPNQLQNEKYKVVSSTPLPKRKKSLTNNDGIPTTNTLEPNVELGSSSNVNIEKYKNPSSSCAHLVRDINISCNIDDFKKTELKADNEDISHQALEKHISQKLDCNLEPNTTTSKSLSTSTTSIIVDKKTKLRDDATLLALLGLSVMKQPNYEDRLPLEECDDLRQKAGMFARHFRSSKNIWQSRSHSSNNIIEDLEKFTKDTNSQFNIDLCVGELKRIVNLVTLWHSYHVDKKLIHKKALTSVNEFYFHLFNFLPKIHHRFYCEHCAETFKKKEQISIHRQVHYRKIIQDKRNTGLKLIKS